MSNQPALGQSKKAFYLFLCSVLGMTLFITLHQLLTGLYFGLVRLGYLPDLALSYMTSALCLFIATLLGSWYGIWLGLYWYHFVYEDGRSPWFHAFRGGTSYRARRNIPADTARPLSSRASADRWQLEDLLDKPTVEAVSNPEAGGRNVTVRSVEVSASDAELPGSIKKRGRKISSAAKSPRSRRPVPNSEEL